MKSTTCSQDSRVVCHMEKPETDLGEIKGRPVSPQKTGSPRSPATAYVSTPLETKSKGPHNKENYRERNVNREVTSDDEVILSSSGFTEDSGYLSLQNSQVEHVDADGADSLERSEEKCVSSQSLHVERHSAPCLPVLKFQEEVCKELAKSFKKSKSYDWTVVNKVAENCGLHNVIGGKMGLEFADILSGLLRKNMRHILARILGLLGDCDLISCKKVSRTWQKIICQDKMALRRCREAERRQREYGRPMGSLSRDFTLSRVVFSCMQGVASTPIHKAVKKVPCQTNGVQNTRSSRFQQFYQVAKSLKQDESLRACVLCGSPARFDDAMQRAVCTRLSCAFDCCTMCQLPFHSSDPCRSTVRSFSSNSSQRTLIAGSARSKRNVRRL